MTRSSRTHCARSLSTLQMITWLNSPPNRARGGGDRVIGLVGHHRPDGDAQRAQRTLRVIELGEELRRHAGIGLVAGIEVVAPRGDDVVGGGRDVGHVRLAQERQHRIQQAVHRIHRPAVGRRAWWAREVGTEQLEGRIHEVQLRHAEENRLLGTPRALRSPDVATHSDGESSRANCAPGPAADSHPAARLRRHRANHRRPGPTSSTDGATR